MHCPDQWARPHDGAKRQRLPGSKSCVLSTPLSTCREGNGSIASSGGMYIWSSGQMDTCSQYIIINLSCKWPCRWWSATPFLAKLGSKCKALASWSSAPSQWADLFVSFTVPVKDRPQGRILGSNNHVLFLSRCFSLQAKAFLDLGGHPKIWRKLNSYSKIKVTVRMAGKKPKFLSCEQFTYIWYKWWSKSTQIKIYYVVHGVHGRANLGLQLFMWKIIH